jgi:DNA helicase-2/ATP-dependent DNA helicase PcrA
METVSPSCTARAPRTDLDPDQLRAVITDAGRALALAGAGSGKTRVLVERIAELIEHRHVSPSEILAVTFTRKAAAEMRTRLEKRIGRAAYGVTMGTMHALALVQLKRFGELLGLRPASITVYSQWESDFLLREVAAEMGILKGNTWKMRKSMIDSTFSTFYATGIEPAEDWPIYGLFQAFMARCRENNALTYGGLLTGLMLLLPKITGYLNWCHILVDEVQDLDRLQWGLIEAMAKALPASLFTVGDVDQSIYAWRGAAPEYLVENADTFEVLRLERNYRSCWRIVDAANHLICHNQMRLPKSMSPVNEKPGWTCSVPGQDSVKIAEEVQACIKNADPAALPVAVLARKHVLLARVAEELDARGVPYLYVGRETDLVNSEQFRRFHAFLKLVVNPYDNFAFMLVREALGLPLEMYAALRCQAVHEDKSHLQVWMENNLWSDFPDHDVLATFAFVSMRWISYADALGSETMKFPETMKFIESYCAGRPAGERTVAAYLDWLATFDIQDELPAEGEQAPAVTLATIHAAKGLEWPYVILAGCNEGILPSKRAVDAGDIEEERRLAYVAITRAREVLTLAVRPERSEKVGKDGNPVVYETPVSRFVTEALGK